MNKTRAHGMKNLRDYYEFKVGRRVADSHWWKVKKVLVDAGMDLSERNLNHYLEIKKHCPRYTSNLGKISNKLKAFSNYAGVQQGLTGNQITYYFSLQNIKATSSTINRWFQSVGGFKKERIYNLKEISVVAIPALIQLISLRWIGCCLKRRHMTL